MDIPCASCRQLNRVPASRLDGRARARCGACKAAIVPVDHPVEVHDVATFDEVIRGSPLPVIVDFWAPWCGPCLAMAPELKKSAVELSGRAVVLKVNVDAVPALGARFGIQSIPALWRFDGGNVTKRTAGAQSATSLAAALGLDRHAA